MSSSDVVLYDLQDGIATITWNRPEANNGWTTELELLYYQYLQNAEADPAVKVIVLTGAGRSFCPGADMNGLNNAASGRGSVGRSEPGAEAGRTPWPVDYPATINKPTIAAINGACAGVGLVQACMLDFRFAVEGAKFTVAFARRGLIAEYGSAWLLPKIVGHANTLDLLMSSRVVLADEAQKMGLVNRVVAKEHLMDAVYEYAADIARNCSPTSMAIMKRQVEQAYLMDRLAATTEAHRLMNLTLRQTDFVEGVKSFVEKRQPTFGSIRTELLP